MLLPMGKVHGSLSSPPRLKFESCILSKFYKMPGLFDNGNYGPKHSDLDFGPGLATYTCGCSLDPHCPHLENGNDTTYLEALLSL